jgi:hypothetical protein
MYQAVRRIGVFLFVVTAFLFDALVGFLILAWAYTA